MSMFEPAPIPDGRETVNGKIYMVDAKGGLQPIETVKPQHQLEDEMVRRVIGFAIALSDQVGRFKAHTFEDIGGFEALLDQEYGIPNGGKRGVKGNRTFLSHDGLFKVEVRIAEHIDFGPELQVAKELIDECLNEWAEDAPAPLRAIVTRAFNTDKAGQINRAEIFALLRHDIDDPRWVKAMDAIRDAMRVVGSKTYVRCHRRDHPDGPWQAITIDLAKA
mgnify:CR=1 FL=1